MSTYLKRTGAFAAALLLALAMGFGLASTQKAYAGEDNALVATGLQVQETPAAIDYAGSDVKFVKDDLETTFGMLSSEDLVATYADGKVHITFTPSSQKVYAGFYINTGIGEVAADDPYPVEGLSDDNWIAAQGEEGSFTYDFYLDESYCGKAWPIAPIKTEARGGGTTGSQYYIAIPSVLRLLTPDPIDYAGSDVKFVKDDLESTFGMFTPNDLVISYADGKVHIAFRPNSQKVYAGFYNNTGIAAVPADDPYPVAGLNDDDWIAAQGEDGSFTYDFYLDESYCGKAWPIAPIKTEARGGGTTGAQYYIAVPSVETFKATTIASVEAKSTSYTYTGTAKKPAVTVKNANGDVVDAANYTVAYKNNTNAGTATITVTGTGSYTGSATTTFTIKQAAQTISASNFTKTYGNSAFALGAKLTKGAGKLTYSSSNRAVAQVSTAGRITIKGAGKTTITVKAAATKNYKAATKNVTVTVKKASQTIKAGKATYTVKYNKKKAQKVSVAFKANGGGKVTYAAAKSGKVSIAKNGKVTVAKGAAKKTYNLKVKVTAAAKGNYAKTTKTVTLKIKVK